MSFGGVVCDSFILFVRSSQHSMAHIIVNIDAVVVLNLRVDCKDGYNTFSCASMRMFLERTTSADLDAFCRFKVKRLFWWRSLQLSIPL